MDEAHPTLYVIDDEAAAGQCAAELAALLGLRCDVFSSAEQFLERADLSLPGCLVSELHLKGMSGLDLQEHLAGLGSILSVILVSANLEVPLVVSAMRNGAVTVLEKPCDAGLLADAIQAAIDLSLATREARRTRAAMQSGLQSLDPRKRQVLVMIVDGVPTKVIARELGVCQRTAARIRADVFEKMGAESAVELAQMAVELDCFARRERPRAGKMHLLNGRHHQLAAVHASRRIQEGATR